ncbi:hypothetical protein S245_048396, partial [Arachis hypogaea]
TEQGVALAILRAVIDFKREPWPQISDSAKSLVRQMLEPDPKKRLTAEQVLKHSWLQNAKKALNVPLGDIVRTRLKQFSVMNRFKKRVLRVIAEHLSVEEGLVPLPGLNNESWCQGLDGLASRSAEYYKQGARFAKWSTWNSTFSADSISIQAQAEAATPLPRVVISLVTIMKLKVDLKCHKCYKKVKKVLAKHKRQHQAILFIG